MQRSLQPDQHPFERAREYKRALNTVKLNKHFAKPFVGAMEGHLDGVQCMAKSPASLATIGDHAFDGCSSLTTLTLVSDNAEPRVLRREQPFGTRAVRQVRLCLSVFRDLSLPDPLT